MAQNQLNQPTQSTQSTESTDFCCCFKINWLNFPHCLLKKLTHVDLWKMLVASSKKSLLRRPSSNLAKRSASPQRTVSDATFCWWILTYLLMPQNFPKSVEWVMYLVSATSKHKLVPKIWRSSVPSILFFPKPSWLFQKPSISAAPAAVHPSRVAWGCRWAARRGSWALRSCPRRDFAWQADCWCRCCCLSFYFSKQPHGWRQQLDGWKTSWWFHLISWEMFFDVFWLQPHDGLGISIHGTTYNFRRGSSSGGLTVVESHLQISALVFHLLANTVLYV